MSGPSSPVRPAPRGTVWFTGLSGAGKTTVATTLRATLRQGGVPVHMIDGDDLRAGLNADLGFSQADRQENVRRAGEVALLVAQLSHMCLVTLISPFAAGRQSIRDRHGELGVPFVEVHVATPLDVCEERDTKGLYARARRGEIRDFTGISSPYETPSHPDLVLDTTGRTPEESVAEVLALLGRLGVAVPAAPR